MSGVRYWSLAQLGRRVQTTKHMKISREDAETAAELARDNHLTAVARAVGVQVRTPPDGLAHLPHPRPDRQGRLTCEWAGSRP
jgi:hypothetical protein